MIAINPETKLQTARDLEHRKAGNGTLATPETLLAALHWRYAVKQYDPSRKIDAATWDALEEALILAPSSGGLQPWKFFVVDDPAVRVQLRDASYGQPQITEADRLVVFAARADFNAADVERFIDRIAAVRGVPLESLAGLKGMLSGIVSRPEAARAEWAGRQVYIALGNFLAAAAALGVDATPMEGLDAAKYDAILGLDAKGYRALAAVPVGYRSMDDKYATLPKVRYDRKDVIEHI
jgi:nitroreductase